MDSGRVRADLRREKGVRAAVAVTGDVVPDGTACDLVAGTVLGYELFSFVRGQGFIGEGLDEGEDGGVFLETGVRQALPVWFVHD